MAIDTYIFLDIMRENCILAQRLVLLRNENPEWNEVVTIQAETVVAYTRILERLYRENPIEIPSASSSKSCTLSKESVQAADDSPGIA